MTVGARFPGQRRGYAKVFVECHSERSEESQVFARKATPSSLNHLGFFAPLRMTDGARLDQAKRQLCKSLLGRGKTEMGAPLRDSGVLMPSGLRALSGSCPMKLPSASCTLTAPLSIRRPRACGAFAASTLATSSTWPRGQMPVEAVGKPVLQPYLRPRDPAHKGPPASTPNFHIVLARNSCIAQSSKARKIQMRDRPPHHQRADDGAVQRAAKGLLRPLDKLLHKNRRGYQGQVRVAPAPSWRTRSRPRGRSPRRLSICAASSAFSSLWNTPAICLLIKAKILPAPSRVNTRPGLASPFRPGVYWASDQLGGGLWACFG